MPLSTTQLYDAAQLEPADFGNVIDPEATEEEKLRQALQYIGDYVLPVAFAEVAGPVREVLGDFTSTFDETEIENIFGQMAPEVLALWEGAEISYGRSELNKRVASNSKSYDEDSDQDRIQGNQRLAKLLSLVRTYIASLNSPVEEPQREEEHYYSTSVPIVSSW